MHNVISTQVHSQHFDTCDLLVYLIPSFCISVGSYYNVGLHVTHMRADALQQMQHSSRSHVGLLDACEVLVPDFR